MRKTPRLFRNCSNPDFLGCRNIRCCASFGYSCAAPACALHSVNASRQGRIEAPQRRSPRPGVVRANCRPVLGGPGGVRGRVGGAPRGRRSRSHRWVLDAGTIGAMESEAGDGASAEAGLVEARTRPGASIEGGYTEAERGWRQDRRGAHRNHGYGGRRLLKATPTAVGIGKCSSAVERRDANETRGGSSNRHLSRPPTCGWLPKGRRQQDGTGVHLEPQMGALRSHLFGGEPEGFRCALKGRRARGPNAKHLSLTGPCARVDRNLRAFNDRERCL